MKFSDIRKRNRAVKTVPFQIFISPDKPREEISIGLRCLGVGESAEIVQHAEAFAIDHDEENPKAGDPQFELGLRLYTCLYACVDPEHPNPESLDARFFSSIEQMLEKDAGGTPVLGRDGICYLFEAQEAWQDQVSPQISHLSEPEAWMKIAEVAESQDPLVFVSLRPALQWSLARFMASLLLTVPSLKSVSGGSTATSTKPSRTSRSKSRSSKPRAKRKTARS